MKTPLLSIMPLILSALFLINNACDDEIPPTGENTFYCYIDGRLFVPKGEFGFTAPPIYPISVGRHPENESYDMVIGGEIRGKRSYIFIYIYNLIKAKEYPLYESNGDMVDGPKQTNAFYGSKDGNRMYLSRSNSGKVIITEYDKEKRIIKGRFEMTLYNKDNPQDVLYITSGRFDFNLKTLNVINP